MLCYFWPNMPRLLFVTLEQKDLPSVTRRADILIAAVGKAHMIKADMG